MSGDAGGRRPPFRMLLAAAAALLALGAIVRYAARLRARAHAPAVRPPTAGRPPAVVRGERAAGAAGEG